MPQLSTRTALRHACRSPLARWCAVLLPLASLAAIGCSGDDALDDPIEEGSTGGTGSADTGGANFDSASAGAEQGEQAAGGQSSSAGADNLGSNGGAPPDDGSMGDPTTDDTLSGETGIFEGMTAAHNEVRAGLALGEPLPDLQWSPEIAAFSQEWSDALAVDCGSIAHRDQRSYGENIALRRSTRVGAPFAAEEAVAGWAAEVACWDYGSIQGSEACDPACAAQVFSNGCGHYTQLIWRNTQQVGCGYSTCEADGWHHEIWVCNYDPPGNFIGQEPY